MIVNLESAGQGTEATGWVTVLGPVGIDGEPLTDRQRSIVTALVLLRARGASTEQLIDAVWPWDAPRAARPALHNQICRLRRRFGDDVIETGPDGYRIHRPSDVDAFERLVGEADRAPDAAATIEVLEQALRLWRGRPFGALDAHPEWEGERARMVALRAGALETLAEARLEVGDVGRAVVDLVVQVEEFPYQERGWELLMEALYLDGRRVEALATFARLAERLDEDLGATPSASARALRRDIDEEVPPARLVAARRRTVLASAS